MKIILNPNEGATRADLLEMACSAHFAIEQGIEKERPGYVMPVTRGNDLRNTFGVVRRKDSLSVYPPSSTTPSA